MILRRRRKEGQKEEKGPSIPGSETSIQDLTAWTRLLSSTALSHILETILRELDGDQ